MSRPREWYEDHENLAELWRWLEDHCDRPDPADFLEKPWHWTPEWNELQAHRAAVA